MTRIGHYELGEKLGAGGMGEVYRARDTKLNRDVAVKVLPEALAKDAERLTRFQREAQVLASLNHPNIAQIYGLEGTALVMELVEGPTLAERIAQGPLPLDETLAIARQVADAMEAAHEQGVVHRDLKPANIKVRGDGAVKVLDFGLAKAMSATSVASGDPSNSPTLTAHATQMGVVIGTAAYMAPEQARGKAVDKRADIWAFGVVLMEMLSGQRVFDGETVSDTLAAVLTREPGWSSLPAATPPAVRRLLERCLDRDPKKRLRDIGDARVILGGPLDSAAVSGAAVAAASPGPRWAVLALVAVAAAVLSVFVWTRFQRTTQPARVTRLSISLPPGQVLTSSGPAVTRDGRTIAYVAREVDGVSRLFVRDLARYESTVIPGSEGALQPFFSPDGARIAFFARGKLMTASLSGGPPTAIADAANLPFGGTWGDDGTIIFVPGLTSGLFRIPAAGGKAERVSEPDGASKGYAHVWPRFLPGRNSLLFLMWGGLNVEASGGIQMPLPANTWTQVTQGIWAVSYATSGHLLVGAEHGVQAAAFDPSKPQRTHAQTFVVEDVVSLPSLSESWFAVSDSGTLVYAPGDLFYGTLSWVDRKGAVTSISNKPESAVDLTVSPDGTRAVLEQGMGIWVVDLRRGNKLRLTEDNTGMNGYPLWSRDGTQVIFGSNRGGDWDIYSAPAGGGPAKRLLMRKGLQIPGSVAPDGTVLFTDRPAATSADLWTLKPDGKAEPLLVSPAGKFAAQFSPSGALIAYVSDETGREEVYVRSFAKPDDVAAVSTEGGRDPRWSGDGKEIFYRRGNAFMAASVSAGVPLVVGDSRKLFEIPAATGRTTFHAGYSVGPDGRFLIQRLDPRAIPTQINVVLNWFEELKSKVPAK